MADLQFKVADKTKWEKLAPPTPPKPVDKYAAILDALEAGEILEIPTADNTDMKGKRITLGRKSKARGFNVEYRTEGDVLYVRKSDAPITPAKPKKEKVTA